MVMERAQRINQIDNGTTQPATGVRRKARHQSASGTARLICEGGMEKQSKVQGAKKKNQHRKSGKW
jgi:hypothetical protein